MARAGDDMMQGLPDPEAEYSTFSGPASTGTGTPKPTMLAPYDIGQVRLRTSAPRALDWARARERATHAARAGRRHSARPGAKGSPAFPLAAPSSLRAARQVSPPASLAGKPRQAEGAAVPRWPSGLPLPGGQPRPGRKQRSFGTRPAEHRRPPSLPAAGGRQARRPPAAPARRGPAPRLHAAVRAPARDALRNLEPRRARGHLARGMLGGAATSAPPSPAQLARHARAQQ